MDTSNQMQKITPSKMESRPTNNLQEQNNTVHDVAKVAVKLALGEENDYVQRLLANKLEGREKKYKTTPVTELLLKPDRTMLKRNLTQAVNITQQKAIDALCEPSNASEGLDSSQHKLCLKKTLSLQGIPSNEQQPTVTTQTPHVIVDIGSFITIPNVPQKTDQNTTNPATNDTQPVIDLSNNQAVSSWVINTLLQEKLNYREVQEKAEKWKNINGILALVLPLVSAVITGLLQHYLTNGNDAAGSQ